MSDMKNMIPSYYKKSRLANAILDALENEFQRLESVISNSGDEMYIDTSVTSLDRWEKDMGLPTNTALSTGERRARVLSRIRKIGTVTPQMLSSFVAALVGTDVEVGEDFQRYMITILFSPNKPIDYANLVQEISEIIPAHLDFNFSRRNIYTNKLYIQALVARRHLKHTIPCVFVEI